MQTPGPRCYTSACACEAQSSTDPRFRSGLAIMRTARARAARQLETVDAHVRL